MFKESHYEYLETHLPEFFRQLGVNWQYNQGIIKAHGDKCYGYKALWEKAGLPFHKGVAIYLLSYCLPYANEVRETEKYGWVKPWEWVINNSDRFLKFLP